MFEAISWLRLFSLVSKSVFVTKFAYVNLASKTAAGKVLISAVLTLCKKVIYDMIIWSVSFFSVSVIFLL